MSRFGLKNHGGHCCGVTHLYLGGVSGPTVGTIKSPPADYQNLQGTLDVVYAYHPTDRLVSGEPSYRAYYIPAPLRDYDCGQGNAGEIADRQLAKFVSSVRSAGIIEVAITDSQRPEWNDWLVARGFVEVGDSRNANTQRHIHMYMLFYDGFNTLPQVIKDALNWNKEADNG